MSVSTLGRITIVKDDALHPGSKAYGILETVLYEVIKLDRKDVTLMPLTAHIETFKKLDTDVILAIGEKALNYLTGLKGVTKYAGTVQSIGKIPLVPIVSPGFLEHNPNYIRKFAEDIHTAYQISIGLSKIEVTNQHVIVRDMETLKKLVDFVTQMRYFSFDFETTELTDKGTFDENFYVTSLSITFQQGSSFVIPLYHEESPFKSTIRAVCMQLDKIFGNPDITKVGQNVKFDLHCAAWLGILIFNGPFHDTMAMHHLIDENLRHGLKDMVREYYPRFANYEKAVGKNWATISFETLARYNAIDSDITFRLYWLFTNILLEDHALYVMYRNLTAPATKTLFHVEENGMLVDKAYLIQSIKRVEGFIEEQETLMRDHVEVRRFNIYRNEVAKLNRLDKLQKSYDEDVLVVYKSKKANENKSLRLQAYENEIKQIKSGELQVTAAPINFNSPDQLKELFFAKEGFGFPLPKQAAMGLAADSTGKENLDLIKDKSGFLEQLQAYRQLKKINSTYLSSIMNKLDENHYVHTNFNQHGTKTGRLSSDKPNMQNIISRTKFKVVEEAVGFVKESFIPPEDYTLVQADYSQIELRIIAHYAQEKTMIRIYQEDKDIHEMTAANSKGYTVEEFQALKESDPKKYKQDRFEAKAENFGFVYGISAEGFKEYARTEYAMHISSREAEKRRDAYFKKYPELLKYHRLYIDKAKKFKYVRTFFGRKVHLPDIDSINGGVRGHAERNAINSPIQGTAGEMTIFAMVILRNRLDKCIQIVNNGHDAIYFYIPDGLVDETLPIIKDTMENLPLQLYFGKTIDSVPIKVDFEKSKKSWKDLKG